ncbi:hypothetical protein B0H13DRAFT_2348083 [Mycena leptocephala]|nr:hypothetical protein B0H13DRAFT_2348083 [Mycena leptocephala]
MVSCIFQLFTLAAVAQCATATLVTLPDPIGFDTAHTVAATIAGVDAQGRTTYAFVGTDAVQKETLTLVSASDYYSFTDEVNNQGATIAIGGECGLQGTNALCTILGDSTEVVTNSQSLILFLAA